LAGEQNGKGFYAYDDKRKARPAPEVKDFIKQSQEDAGIMPNGKVRDLLISVICLLIENYESL